MLSCGKTITAHDPGGGSIKESDKAGVGVIPRGGRITTDTGNEGEATLVASETVTARKDSDRRPEIL